MTAAPQTMLMGWIGLLMFPLGFAAAIYVTLTFPDSPLHQAYSRYAKYVDVELRSMFIQNPTGKQVANWQLGIIAALLLFEPAHLAIMGVGSGLPIALVGVPVVAIAPKIWLSDARAKRQLAIEAQLDTFLLALANALKASPSLGDALGACAILMRAPMKQELELTMKENQLGMPLDTALLNMASRVGTRAFSGALTTVLIGRQTGGDLPKILETSASTLREMARLEGVVRTKTAEGKAQAWVLGVMPPILIGILNWIDPEWLTPLYVNFIGNILLLVAVIFWIASVVLARKILAVDI